MSHKSLHKAILGIFETYPLMVFTTKDLANIFKYKSQEKAKKELITMVLFRLYKEGIIQRTPTQLSNGYYYSKENNNLLEKIYQIHLIPYELPNKQKLSKQLTRKTFNQLKENHYLDLEVLENKILTKRYGKSYLSKEKTQEYLVLLVAFIMCDGNINKEINRSRFYFRRERDAKLFSEKFTEVFYLDRVRTYPSSDKSCFIAEISKGKNFAQFLHSIGAPSGNKTSTPFLIPNWILHGPNPIKKVFISTIIGNEGSAPVNRRWRIQFVLSKKREHVTNLIEFINQIRSMIYHFNINTSHIQLRKQKNRKFHTRFYIKGKKDIHKFYKNFSFLYASEKQEILENLINSQDVEYAMIT